MIVVFVQAVQVTMLQTVIKIVQAHVLVAMDLVHLLMIVVFVQVVILDMLQTVIKIVLVNVLV